MVLLGIKYSDICIPKGADERLAARKGNQARGRKGLAIRTWFGNSPQSVWVVPDRTQPDART